jgi:hypothetical protein
MLFYKIYHTKVVDIKMYLNTPLLSNTLQYYIMFKNQLSKEEIIQVLNILLDEGADPNINESAFIWDLIYCQDWEIFTILLSRIHSSSIFTEKMLLYSLNFNCSDISNYILKHVKPDDYQTQINIMYKLMINKNNEGLLYCLENGYSISDYKTKNVIKHYSNVIDIYIKNLKTKMNKNNYIHRDIVNYEICNYLY